MGMNIFKVCLIIANALCIAKTDSAQVSEDTENLSVMAHR